MKPGTLRIPNAGRDTFALSEEQIAAFIDREVVDSNQIVRGKIVAAVQLSDRIELTLEIDDDWFGELVNPRIHSSPQLTLRDDWTEEFEIGSCDHCERENVRVIHDVDPYIAEVEPEDANRPSNWCYECWSDRKDQV